MYGTPQIENRPDPHPPFSSGPLAAQHLGNLLRVAGPVSQKQVTLPCLCQKWTKSILGQAYFKRGAHQSCGRPVPTVCQQCHVFARCGPFPNTSWVWKRAPTKYGHRSPASVSTTCTSMSFKILNPHSENIWAPPLGIMAFSDKLPGGNGPPQGGLELESMVLLLPPAPRICFLNITSQQDVTWSVYH